MYIKEKNGKIEYLCPTKKEADMIKISQQELEKLNSWYQYKNWKIVETKESKKNEKRKTLKQKNIEDIKENENYKDLWLSNKELWELICDKFYSGNIFAELCFLRKTLQKLIKDNPKMKEEQKQIEKIENFITKF